jgi:hypothetical protein
MKPVILVQIVRYDYTYPRYCIVDVLSPRSEYQMRSSAL